MSSVGTVKRSSRAKVQQAPKSTAQVYAIAHEVVEQHLAQQPEEAAKRRVQPRRQLETVTQSPSLGWKAVAKNAAQTETQIRADNVAAQARVAAPAARKLVRKWPTISAIGAIGKTVQRIWHNREQIEVELDCVMLQVRNSAGKLVEHPYMVNFAGAKLIQALYIPSAGMVLAVTDEVAKQLRENAELMRPMVERKREAAEAYAAAHANDLPQSEIADMFEEEGVPEWIGGTPTDEDYQG